MSSLFQLQAVVETPAALDDCFDLWDVPLFKPFSWIRLSGKTTSEEIGLVFAQLIQYNHLDFSSEKQVVLQQILETDDLILPGGIQVVFGDRFISPSCCCGLERWREWQDFLRTGQSPWLGHDPSPWVERQGDLVCIWSDGGLSGSIQNPFHIEVSYSIFQERLRRVERDLQSFLLCLGRWVQEIGFEQSNDLIHQFDRCFHVGRQY
jgi:hypothetical protein